MINKYRCEIHGVYYTSINNGTCPICAENIKEANLEMGLEDDSEHGDK